MYTGFGTGQVASLVVQGKRRSNGLMPVIISLFNEQNMMSWQETLA